MGVSGGGGGGAALGCVRVFFGTEEMIFTELPGLLMPSDEGAMKCGGWGTGEEGGVGRELGVLDDKNQISFSEMEK